MIITKKHGRGKTKKKIDPRRKQDIPVKFGTKQKLVQWSFNLKNTQIKS